MIHGVGSVFNSRHRTLLPLRRPVSAPSATKESLLIPLDQIGHVSCPSVVESWFVSELGVSATIESGSMNSFKISKIKPKFAKSSFMPFAQIQSQRSDFFGLLTVQFSLNGTSTPSFIWQNLRV